MNATASPTQLTPEDLLAMPDEKAYELVDGQLREREGCALSSWIGGLIYAPLSAYARAHGMGLVWPADNAFQCFPSDLDKVRRPDVSFIRRERLPADILRQGYVQMAPDLVVEVISPNEQGYEIEEKISDYLSAKVPLIWAMYPTAPVVMVYRPDSSVSRLNSKDELSGEQVLQGFTLWLADLFRPLVTPLAAG